MSTLVLVLATAIAVPGNGPEKGSAEMEQGLDLRSEWEGRWQHSDGKFYQVEGNHGLLEGCTDNEGLAIPTNCLVDEGEGRLRITCLRPRFGIYEVNGDRLTICWDETGRRRPTSFRAGDGQHLLILHRVKLRK